MMSTGQVFVLFAAGITGYTGFGFNLVAVPLLALVMPVREAIVVGLVVGTVVQLTLAGTSILNASTKRVTRLGVGAITGVAFGAVLFREASATALALGVSSMTLCFGVLMLFPSVRWRRAPAGILSHTMVGAFAGLLSATTGMSGPPVVAFIATSEQDAVVARATISCFIALTACLAVVGLVGLGSVPISILTGAVQYLPAGLIGVAVGSIVFHSWPKLHHAASATLLIAIGTVGLLSEVFSG